MRKLQKSKIVLQKGKQESEEKVGAVKKVVDSTAEYLILQSESTIANAKRSEGIQIITVWKDLGELKKVVKTAIKKKVTKKD